MQQMAERAQSAAALTWRAESRSIEVCRTPDGREVGHVSRWVHDEWLAYVRVPARGGDEQRSVGPLALGSRAVCRRVVEQQSESGERRR